RPALALAFARKLSLAAHSVTDKEVEDLVERYGEERVVAMVHTLAHANFQCRIFLALDVRLEPGGPLPPLDMRLDPERSARVLAPPRPPWKETLEAGADLGRDAGL